MEHVIIGFDEPRYYLGIIATVAFYVLFLSLLKRLGAEKQTSIIQVLGAVILLSSIAIHPILVLSDDLQWSIHRALPLHLCGFNYLLVGINCFLRKRWLWEINLFLGIIGGFHSLLTPELAQGDAPYFLLFYYFEHGALFFVPILFFYLFEFRLDPRSWLKVFVWTNAFAVIIFGINWILNTWMNGEYMANYFYLWEPPEANNPIIIGDWPWYLIPCEIAMIIHLFVIQWIFTGRMPLRRAEAQ